LENENQRNGVSSFNFRFEQKTGNMGLFQGQNNEHPYINVLLNQILLCEIIQILK